MGADCPRPRLLPCNRRAVEAFAEFASTQWRRGGMGQRMGLDYGAVLPLLQAHWPRGWKRVFAGVRTIEHALLVADADVRGAAADGNAY